jgi:Tol biopolymer transport system component
MTAFERIEPRLPELIDELAAARVPDYFDTMLQATAQARQRPAWSAPERWLPMGVLAQTSSVPRVPWRQIALVALLIIGLLAAGLAVAGSWQPAIPVPFGVAGNGLLLYRAPDGTIRSVDPDSGDTATISTASDGRGDPVASRDGRRIAFLPTDPVASPIIVTDIDGSDPVRLAGEYRDVSWPDWSPDSKQLAIVSSVAGIPSVSVLQADGSGAQTLRLGRAVDQSWYLPDGRLALLASAEPGQVCALNVPTNQRHCDLFTVNPDGSGFERVLDRAGFAGIRFHPSPDGTKLVYVLWADGAEGRLHVVDLLTGEDRPLPIEGIDAEYSINRAWFSPDGSSILFDLFEEAGVHWAIVPASGGAVRKVGPERPGGTDASWSPDGRSVLARYATDTESELWLLDGTGSGADRQLDVNVPYLPDWQRIAPS